jgi:23S rRNA G2445 N2-methylase RlmL
MLINDPTGSPWMIRISRISKGSRSPSPSVPPSIELEPRRLADPRFAYRQTAVYAASHPTLAAALARVAGVRADDTVWDPFTGAGTELIERALLGPAMQLIGTDLDPRAVACAATNLEAAGITVPARMVAMDCLAFQDAAPTLIISNPPMGRRVQRGTLGPLLERFSTHAAAVLAPGGRLVWLAPDPKRTDSLLKAAGLSLAYRQPVDMGGFDAELQRWDKRLPGSPRPRLPAQ